MIHICITLLLVYEVILKENSIEEFCWNKLILDYNFNIIFRYLKYFLELTSILEYFSVKENSV